MVGDTNSLLASGRQNKLSMPARPDLEIYKHSHIVTQLSYITHASICPVAYCFHLFLALCPYMSPCHHAMHADVVHDTVQPPTASTPQLRVCKN